ncbi:MAG: hypothetical protein OEW58_12650 [Gammaproteobacteria bacterium]|nr:hypothetical protein [Gammaproteobacteria bacterium]
MEKISADRAFFIKLGERGGWESDCIKNGRIELGYLDVNHDLCVSGKWDEVRETFPYGANSGAKTRHLNQVKAFYEEPNTTLWITFFSDRMWWCFADEEVVYLPGSKSKYRRVIGEWKDVDVNGDCLTKSRLSGKLLAVQSFQGTICSIGEREYLLHKINGTNEPHVEAAELAFEHLRKSLIPIIKNLHPKDFEIFTDLIFRQGGWKRSGVAGEVEKDIDMALISPISGESIAVQVKSTSNKATYDAYKKKFVEMAGFSKFYYVTHSPSQDLVEEYREFGDDSFILWDEDELSRQAVKGGIVDWLIDRAS